MQTNKKKKKYEKPKIEVFKLEPGASLLQSSDPNSMKTCFGAQCNE